MIRRVRVIVHPLARRCIFIYELEDRYFVHAYVIYFSSSASDRHHQVMRGTNRLATWVMKHKMSFLRAGAIEQLEWFLLILMRCSKRAQMARVRGLPQYSRTNKAANSGRQKCRKHLIAFRMAQSRRKGVRLNS